MEDLICFQRGFDSKNRMECAAGFECHVAPGGLRVGGVGGIWASSSDYRTVKAVCVEGQSTAVCLYSGFVRNMAWRLARGFAAPADWLRCSSCLAGLVKTADFIKLLTLWQTACFCTATTQYNIKHTYTHTHEAVSRCACCYCAVIELLFLHRLAYK